MGVPRGTEMCLTLVQMVVLMFLLSSWAFSPLFHKVEQSRCVYPKWASTTWTPHTYTVTSFSLASACCILPFRSDPASYRFWSGSVLLGIGLLSFTVCLSWLQALMGGKHPIAWLVSYIFQTGRVRGSHVEIGLQNLKWEWCLLFCLQIPLMLYWTVISSCAILVVIAQSSSSPWLAVLKAKE